jgi:hypothetical protein
VDTHQEKLTHLAQLSAELASRGLSTQLVGSTTARPCLKVANASTPRLNERVYIQQADDGTWTFYWPWNQPIGPATDLAAVTTKITTVLRNVEGQSGQLAAPQHPPATSGGGQEC